MYKILCTETIKCICWKMKIKSKHTLKVSKKWCTKDFLLIKPQYKLQVFFAVFPFSQTFISNPVNVRFVQTIFLAFYGIFLLFNFALCVDFSIFHFSWTNEKITLLKNFLNTIIFSKESKNKLLLNRKLPITVKKFILSPRTFKIIPQKMFNKN